MDASVCVLTARGMAAIASVALAGPDARTILQEVFQPMRRAGGFHPPKQGAILHGSIVDGDTVIDEVIVGCENDLQFVIHCHGNLLLVEQVVKLCQAHGATLAGAELFMSQMYQSQSANTIEAEAKLAMQTCATLAGAKIIANQLTCGLLPTAQGWLDGFDDMSLQTLWGKCHQVLRKTSRAKYLINRCRIPIIGPPNSGKSTLLNRLAGNDEVLVTDMAGTTRDWVSITCRIGPLLAEVYDTAGLDASLTQQHEIDCAAQQTTTRLIRSADMSIFVYDVTNEHQAQMLLFSMGGFKGIIVANKCDLLSPQQRRNIFSKYVRLCAKTGDGIDQLTQTLLAAMKVADFDPRTPVCFTDRQLHILRQILHIKDKPTAKKQIETLLFGDNPV